MNSAMKRITAAKAFSMEKDVWTQIGDEIVRAGEGEKFLKSVRRGRATQRQNGRYQIMRVVEAAIGSSVPRRRDDNNTPEATRRKLTLELQSVIR